MLTMESTREFPGKAGLMDRLLAPLGLADPPLEAVGAQAVTGLAMKDGKRCQAQISGRDRERILSVVTHIEQSFSDSCSIDALAAIAGSSRFHFMRQFKAVTGRSPNQYIISLRLRVAAARIAETNARILQIALECGFNDISHFNIKFRTMFGCTPRQMRNRSQGRHDCREAIGPSCRRKLEVYGRSEKPPEKLVATRTSIASHIIARLNDQDLSARDQPFGILWPVE
jgi:AraC-like DNA-binding protein